MSAMRYLRSRSRKAPNPADVAQDIITKAQNALFLLHRSLDLAAIEQAAEHLAKADMIYAFGSGGNSSMIASELQNRLFRFGLRITASSDHSMQLMMAAAAKPGDVLIGSSFSGRNAELVRSFTLARETKVTSIALTQSGQPCRASRRYRRADRPCRKATISIRPDLDAHRLSRAVDILASLVAYNVQPQAAVTLRRIKQQLVAHRDGDDRQLLGD
jgi:DNA-binding MurR/RpiR family transcriptional regulator